MCFATVFIVRLWLSLSLSRLTWCLQIVEKNQQWERAKKLKNYAHDLNQLSFFPLF